MSFFKGLVDSLGSIFTETARDSTRQYPSNPQSPDSSEPGGNGALPVTNERAAYKLKGYFDLAKQEIAKAVRAEEWGLVDDAIVHYKNAQRILLEGSSTTVPSYVSSRYSAAPASIANFIFFNSRSPLFGTVWLECGAIGASL